MVKSPFVETIEKILAPLRFAVSGGEDRALERARLVKNFESHVKKGFKEAKSLRISLRTKEDLSSIERNFFERERINLSSPGFPFNAIANFIPFSQSGQIIFEISLH